MTTADPQPPTPGISPSETSFLSDKETSPKPRRTRAPPDQPRSTLSRFWSYLPSWVFTNLRSARSWKVMLRCWIACWGAFVILLPQQSLKTVGTTSFFALLTSLFLPPYLPVQMFFIITSTLMIGLLSGWGIGIAAMRAANASRSQALLQAAAQGVKASIAASPVFQANPALAQTSAIFHGEFLDIRSTAVYGCFLGFGAFIFGLMRAYAPKLLFMSIFGTIAVDIMCAVGPLFPAARYTLLKSTAVSISCYMGIALLTTIFVFPETMNHSSLAAMSDQLEKIQELMLMQDEVLHSSPTELAFGTPLVNKIKRARAVLISAQQQLMAVSGFISLEFSWGKWNSDDVQALEEPLVAIVTRIAGVQSFAKLVGEPRFGIYNQERNSSSLSLSNPTTNDTYLLRQIHKRSSVIEVNHSVRIEDMLPVIDEATAELRQACYDGVEAARAVVDLVNKRRWNRNADIDAAHTRQLDEAITRLLSTLVAFKETDRRMLVEPFLPLIIAAKSRDEQEALPLRSLYLAFVFGSNLIAISNGVLSFMELIRDTVNKRKSNRLWAPKGLRNLWKLLTSRGDKTDGTFGEDTSAQPAKLQKDEQAYRRDPDSKPPTNLFQKLMNSMHVLYTWSKTAEASFTFKYVFVSIALWLPAVVKSTANFYYVEKGIWALIMAQTTLNIYAADQIFNLITRLIGTFTGLILGLVAWYMGNGTGNGNPYGVAASVGLFIVPLVFVRIFAPPQYLAGIVLACATFALVVGYSWVDSHLPQFATPGVGWSVAWKRWTLVIIGAGASFAMMMLPPKSGRKAVRQRNASSIVTLSNIYGFLLETWIATRADDKILHTPAQWIREFRMKLIAMAEEMQTIRELTELAKWEGSIRGAWPAEEYNRLVDVQTEMLSSLALLGGALGQLEDNWRLTFLHSTNVLNPNFIADVMSIFSLTSQSLRTGEPMHQVLPHTLLDRLFYHQGRTTGLVAIPGESRSAFSLQEINSIDHMYYATGLVAVYQLLQSIDELHKITKGLCGEVPLRGFATWRDEYERHHTLV